MTEKKLLFKKEFDDLWNKEEYESLDSEDLSEIILNVMCGDVSIERLLFCLSKVAK